MFRRIKKHNRFKDQGEVFMNIEKRFLNVPEVATYLGFSKSAIRKWIRQGTIPFNKVNGGIRFDMERINQWLQKHSVGVAKQNYN